MIDRLIRAHLKKFEPYRSARSEVREAHTFLDANELSIGSPISVDNLPLNRYPDPLQVELRTTLAAQFNLSPDSLFVGVGSDEIIDLLIRLLCEPGKDRVMILEPTYGVYRVAADVNAVEVAGVDLDAEFHIDSDRTCRALSPGTKILFCCSPNNPTGNLLRADDLFTLCRMTEGIVVVDEAYVEFSDRAGGLVADVSRFENLVVLRTLSKAWGSAGIRLGYCIAHPLIVSYLLRIKAPYSMNAVTSGLGLKALGNRGFFEKARSVIVQERGRLAAELRRLPSVVRVYPSDANFILAEFADVRKAFDALYANGIVVRRRSEPRLVNCLRITIGTPGENTSLLSTLMEVH